jgi:acetyltransferase-like isoleucine patch superfamily enzyme
MQRMRFFSKKAPDLFPNPSWTVGPGSTVNTGNVSAEILAKVRINAGRNCSIDLSGLVTVNVGVEIYMADDSRLLLGPGQDINNTVRLYMHEPSSITVGSDCLWATGDVWTSDMHSIIDDQTGERTNHVGDVVIGDRVWLGQDFLVLGGSTIGDDSVVAARSVLTGKTYPSKSLIGGQPARVLRNGIRWDQRLL